MPKQDGMLLIIRVPHLSPTHLSQLRKPNDKSIARPSGAGGIMHSLSIHVLAEAFGSKSHANIS